MWLIRKCGFKGSHQTNSYAPFLYVTRFMRANFIILAQLYNTDTGEVKDMQFKGIASLKEMVLEYDPYGFIVVPEGVGGFDGQTFLMVAIDNLSWKFLGLVSDISKVTLSDTHSLYRGLSMEFSETVAMDKSNSIFDVSNSALRAARCASTLFGIACFSKAGWYNDELYFRTSIMPQFDGENGLRNFMIAYRVRFTDKEKARSLVAKAVMSGFNPILQTIQNES